MHQKSGHAEQASLRIEAKSAGRVLTCFHALLHPVYPAYEYEAQLWDPASHIG